MFTFIKKIYKNQRKDYVMLLIILIFLSSFEFTFLAMYDAFTQFNLHWTVRSALHGIPVLASLVALVLNIFVTKYFIENKKQEFSILLLSGRKPKDLLIYLLLQFLPLMVIAYIIAAIIGSAFMYLINWFPQIQNSTLILNYSFINVCFYSFMYFVFAFIVILALCAHQFVNLDKDLAKYLSQKASISKPAYIIKASAVSSKRKIPWLMIIFSLGAIYLTVASLLNLLQTNLSTTDLLMSFTYALAGIFMLVMTVIPLLYDLLHHRLLKHPILMNALSSFNEFARVMVVLATLNMIILPIQLFLIFFGAKQELIQAITLPCFIMMIIMIALSFILRFFIYNQESRSTFAKLNAIGYSPHILNQITLIKNILFLFLIFIIPLLFMGELFYRAYNQGLLSINIISIMMITYLIINCLVFIYTCVQERISLKEVTQNVKYLNRGQ
ncbi:FtsX-like permease family protein [Candidatus Stoquefichus massiliensis]|uniref:FtsX-like permease family protein n=1 Tax=Candidatus Stoquefichus massiliensis TaxID=1470350 RepID=UPI000488A301|nr:FtsX-like permease family protein [Candidatus Stoquefichus massiliensis]